MVEAVLAHGELIGLVAHYVGVGDAEVMEAYDRVARARGAGGPRRLRGCK
jgi:hypothetical protein